MFIKVYVVISFWLIGSITSFVQAQNQIIQENGTAQTLIFTSGFNEGTEDDNWGNNWDDEEERSWRVSGFVEGALGQFSQDNVVESEQSLSEIRARIDVNYSHQKFELVASADVLFDDVLNDNAWHTRELFVSFSPLSALDLKVGRQVMTWGTGDYLFLNDLFPKDWQSFFSGRDDEYLKAPADSVRATAYINNFSVDIALTPKFTADNYINGERFSFYSPINELNGNTEPEHFPVESRDNSQFSMRISTTKSGIEYTVYGYQGYWSNPVGIHLNGEHQGKAFFPKMNSYGASVRLPIAKGLLNVESAVYNSVEDSDGDKANIPNNQVKLLVGYEQELVKNLTGAVQYYVEHMQDYANYEKSTYFAEQIIDQNRQILTARLTHRAIHQKLVSSLFVFYSPSDHDGYIKPMLSYRQNDHWNYSLGANLFWGQEEYTFFGQHQENSNYWLRVKFNY
ncbi:hypothetical protein [Thalassotalea atypica]|uniref:hypothetical protein n=1 Tax=Thalassotalea atypica TaxID=2054316 RepID=UPI002573F609|nr:hypothetical protein [Thalassotalea atypica]